MSASSSRYVPLAQAVQLVQRRQHGTIAHPALERTHARKHVLTIETRPAQLRHAGKRHEPRVAHKHATHKPLVEQQETWFSAPWWISENYFYKRMLEMTDPATATLNDA